MKANCLFYLAKFDKKEKNDSEAFNRLSEAYQIAESILGPDDPVSI